jgi:6-phosphofructokinase 1
MNRKIKHIGIFTSGGDAPGMNTALFAVAKTAESEGIKVSGIRRGFEGLIDNDVISLNSHQLRRFIHEGGTILKTARSERFMSIEGRKKAQQTILKNGFDALICIGGDGTFRGMLEFSELSEIPFIGIPGTIDNDLDGTDFTLGFDSAVNTAVRCIDNIRDTAESHNRVFVVEVMGRDSGYIGIYAGLSSGANSILIPESSEDFSYLLHKISNYNSEDAYIVVVAEGDDSGVEMVTSQIRNVNSHIKLGVLATRALTEGESAKMAGLSNNQLLLSPFEDVLKKHLVDGELKALLALFCQ